jgi:hypothetical protein
MICHHPVYHGDDDSVAVKTLKPRQKSKIFEKSILSGVQNITVRQKTQNRPISLAVSEEMFFNSFI